MQTLKNIHKEYLNKLAEEIVNKACVKECKCDSDDLTEKKKCLFRKILSGSDKALVELCFDVIDAVSEVLYTKTVDDMAYPELIRDHFSQTKAKCFYKVLYDEFELVIFEIFKKVCLKIPDICREKPGFEELTNYAKQELLEYFTFKKVFSYSRYMIENHSYIEDWFPIADMDTDEILEAAEREPRTLYMMLSDKNCMDTKNIEELLEYTYNEMYKKDFSRLKSIFVDGIFKDTSYNKEDQKIFEGRLVDEYDEEYENGLKTLIECYQNLGVTEKMYYSDINEKIGIITSDSGNGARKKKSLGDIVDRDGNYIKGKCENEIINDIKKLVYSRLKIYESQLEPLNDNMFYERSNGSKSKGDLNSLIRKFYKDLYGLNLSEIYTKAPYYYKDSENDKHPIMFLKHIKVIDVLLNYYNCMENDEYKMLLEWNLHYNRIKAYDYIFVSSYGCRSEAHIAEIVDDTAIENKEYYEDVYRETEELINKRIVHKIEECGVKGKYKEMERIKNEEWENGEKIFNENKKAVRDLIEALTIAIFVLSPDCETLKEAMCLPTNESKKARGLIDMVFIEI